MIFHIFQPRFQSWPQMKLHNWPQNNECKGFKRWSSSLGKTWTRIYKFGKTVCTPTNSMLLYEIAFWSFLNISNLLAVHYLGIPTLSQYFSKLILFLFYHWFQKWVWPLCSLSKQFTKIRGMVSVILVLLPWRNTMSLALLIKVIRIYMMLRK